MLLFHTDNLAHYGLERIFEFAKKAGFKGIEVGVGMVYDTQDASYLKKLEKRYGVKIRAFSLSARHEGKLMRSFQETVREFPGCVINMNPSQVLSFQYKKWLDNTIPKLAKKYQLVACRKNAPIKMILGFLPKRSGNSLEALKNSGKVCLDLSALAQSHEDVMQAVNYLGSHLVHIYLSNVSGDQPYAVPEKGILPVESFLVKLAHKGFHGDFTLKINPKFLSEGDEEILLAKMIKSRKFYEKYFEKEFRAIPQK